ncbi:uncharacterized protein LOC127126968 [Lathyrus oleraceus]|uniref:uncharacterized protein LOC127126968 n=1 Tax=Pisum sativum TaxID=3888 RepID=UPI0021D0BFB4|nr:uncharacterized protein LOC127126968 [Pisum sativum]
MNSAFLMDRRVKMDLMCLNSNLLNMHDDCSLIVAGLVWFFARITCRSDLDLRQVCGCEFMVLLCDPDLVEAWSLANFCVGHVCMKDGGSPSLKLKATWTKRNSRTKDQKMPLVLGLELGLRIF